MRGAAQAAGEGQAESLWDKGALPRVLAEEELEENARTQVLAGVTGVATVHRADVGAGGVLAPVVAAMQRMLLVREFAGPGFGEVVGAVRPVAPLGSDSIRSKASPTGMPRRPSSRSRVA